MEPVRPRWQSDWSVPGRKSQRGMAPDRLPTRNLARLPLPTSSVHAVLGPEFS
jgi:hypothetical protein